MTTVRDAGPADARGIAQVHVRAWHRAYRDLMPRELLDGLSIDNRERAWRELLHGGEARTLVAEAEPEGGSPGPIVGFATATLPARDDDATPDTAEIAALYVDPDHWRSGVASTLLRNALIRVSLDGAEEVTVWVLEGNAGGIAFYEQAGFHADDVRAPHEPSGADQVRYRLSLKR